MKAELLFSKENIWGKQGVKVRGVVGYSMNYLMNLTN